jgi:hypothetical protein
MSKSAGSRGPGEGRLPAEVVAGVPRGMIAYSRAGFSQRSLQKKKQHRSQPSPSDCPFPSQIAPWRISRRRVTFTIFHARSSNINRTCFKIASGCPQ